MFKFKTVAQICFFMAAMVGLYSGKQAGNSQYIGLGLGCFGPIMMIYGLDAIRSRQFGFRSKHWSPGTYEMYQGLSAQLWGVYFILLGLLVVAFGVGYAFYPGGPEKLWSGLLGTHLGIAFILGLLGLMVAIDGFIRVVAGTAGRNTGLPTGVGNCLERLVGGFVFLFGMAFIGVAVVVVLSPHLITSLFEALIAPLK